jgi:MFS family permease
MLRRPHPHATGSSTAANDQSAASQERSNRTAFLLLLTSAALINSDQNLLSPNMSACAADFGFTKQEKDEKLGGTLAAGLFLAGAPAAIAVGVAADGAMRRVDLLRLVLLLGSIGCLGSALASSFWQLFAARALTGVSLGGGLPVTFSLMGDMFEPSERAVQSGRQALALALALA